jgi:hypothetical protein
MCTESKGPEVLASSEGLGSVALCGCGTVSLHVQAMSLRMDLKAFQLAAAMIQRALVAMEQRSLLISELEGRASNVLLH